MLDQGLLLILQNINNKLDLIKSYELSDEEIDIANDIQKDVLKFIKSGDRHAN